MCESEVCSPHSRRSIIQKLDRCFDAFVSPVVSGRAMATWSSQATSPNTELGTKDLSALLEALYPVRAKYRFLGLQIGVSLDEIEDIETNYEGSSNFLLKILSARLKQEPALTCGDIDNALRSQTVNEPHIAKKFKRNFKSKSITYQRKRMIESDEESSKKKMAEKYKESVIHHQMSEKGSEKTGYVESEDESKSDKSENIQKAIKSAEVERQVHERDEPKSKRAKKRARKKESAVKNKYASEQPVSESAIQFRISKKENERRKRIEREDESKSDKSENMKSAEVERQVHEKDEPKSKRARKRARKKEKNQCASEQPEPDGYKEDERKQIKGKQKQKFSEMAASPQSGAESDQKRKKSVKESEKTAPEIMSTDSENESSNACKEKEMLLSKSEKTGKVRECAAYSELKHQPQSAKIKEVKNEARKKGKIPEKEGSTKKQHSLSHRKTAVAVESDEDTSEQPSHKSKKKLEAEETDSEDSFSESTSDESESESPRHKEKVKPIFPTDTEEMYHDSDEEIEKVRAKDENKMPQKSKVATAKSSPHSERLVEEEQYKQKKGKRSVDMKEHKRESELRAKASRRKLQKTLSQVKEREKVKETDSGMKAKRLVARSSEQASDESETDCENEESDSGNDSSEDEEDSEVESSDEEEKTEVDEESSTFPSQNEVKKKKKKEKSVSHEKEKAKKESFEEERKLMEKRISKAAVEQSKYYSLQRGRQFDEPRTRKVKGKRESGAASLKYDSPGDDKQSDPGHYNRDQEEHDIQQKRRKKKKQRRESSMSPTANGSSSPSTSQEEKKKQPVSKKQGHRKKHVRKMKEKRERMKRGKEKRACLPGTDDSSPECDMTKKQYEGEMKELVNIFERFFGKLCCAVFDPKDVAAELQSVVLISKSMMREMMLSPESQQAKIIALVDELDKMIKSCPDHLFMIIEVMLKNEALQETAREILREIGTQCFVCALYFVLDSKTLFPAGRVYPVETAAKFPSQVPPSDTAVPSTADTLSPIAKGIKDYS